MSILRFDDVVPFSRRPAGRRDPGARGSGVGRRTRDLHLAARPGPLRFSLGDFVASNSISPDAAQPLERHWMLPAIGVLWSS